MCKWGEPGPPALWFFCLCMLKTLKHTWEVRCDQTLLTRGWCGQTYACMCAKNSEAYMEGAAGLNTPYQGGVDKRKKTGGPKHSLSGGKPSGISLIVGISKGQLRNHQTARSCTNAAYGRTECCGGPSLWLFCLCVLKALKHAWEARCDQTLLTRVRSVGGGGQTPIMYTTQSIDY